MKKHTLNENVFDRFFYICKESYSSYSRPNYAEKMERALYAIVADFAQDQNQLGRQNISDSLERYRGMDYEEA